MDVLSSHINAQKDDSEKVVFKLRELGFKPKSEQYQKIISTLRIIYKDKFDNINELIFSITDGDDDGGFDAVVFTKDSLDIFDFKMKSKSQIGQKEVQYLTTRLKSTFISKPTPLVCSTNARLEKILKKWWRKKLPLINVVFVRKNIGDLDRRVQNELSLLRSIDGVNTKFYDDKTLVKLLLEEDYLQEWVLPTTNVVELIRDTRGISISSIILKVPLNLLLKLYKDHLDFNKNLFARNVRLPKSNQIFKNSIRESIENSPHKFYMMHNGIVIVASSLKINAGNIILTEPQVINGAQTIGSLYSSYKNDIKNKKLSQAMIICKILVSQDSYEIQTICETSNTQKAVKLEDLRTNDIFQIKLEVFLSCASNHKYYLNRKGSPKPKGARSITLGKFYQWCYSVFCEQPADAKNAKSKIFSKNNHLYNDLILKMEQRSKELVRLCDIALFVEDHIKNYPVLENRGLLKIMNMHIISAMFYLNSLDVIDLNRIFEIHIDYFNRAVKANPSLNANLIFTKNPQTWIDIKSIL